MGWRFFSSSVRFIHCFSSRDHSINSSRDSSRNFSKNSVTNSSMDFFRDFFKVCSNDSVWNFSRVDFKKFSKVFFQKFVKNWPWVCSEISSGILPKNISRNSSDFFQIFLLKLFLEFYHVSRNPLRFLQKICHKCLQKFLKRFVKIYLYVTTEAVQLTTFSWESSRNNSSIYNSFWDMIKTFPPSTRVARHTVQ